MIAYYEGETRHPPTIILPRLAQALGLSADDLLNGGDPRTASALLVAVGLRHTFARLEMLGAKERRQAIRWLERFIERQASKGQE